MALLYVRQDKDQGVEKVPSTYQTMTSPYHDSEIVLLQLQQNEPDVDHQYVPMF